MIEWLRVYNEVDVIPIIEAIDKTHQLCYPNEIDMLKDVVSILGNSMTCMLNKALKTKKHGYPDLYAPDQSCIHKCQACEVNPSRICPDCKGVRDEWIQCAKTSHTNC